MATAAFLDFGPNFAGRVWGAEPNRGNLVVFKLPRDNKTDYIKRLIGLPGDRIQMRGGVVFINGTAVPKKQTEDFVNEKGEGFGRPVPQYVETLPNGVTYRVLDSMPNGAADNTDEYVFRTATISCWAIIATTRSTAASGNAPGGGVGYVPYENLIGKAVLIYWNSLGIRIDDRLKGYPGK